MGRFERTAMRESKPDLLKSQTRAGPSDNQTISFTLGSNPPAPDQAETYRLAARDLAILQDFFDRRRTGLPQHEHDDQQRGPRQRETGNK